MATTTNFGWETPDDTDLVKDGALAMRTLGNSIDTSFVDLKGGTTGQILSKASNTDLDYTWITNDVGDITNISVTAPVTGGGSSGSVTIGIDDGTTTQKGAVQLEDSTSSTSTTKAATPNSVKSAYDLANGAIAKSLVDAKGDLIVGTADNTVARLASSATNGNVLTVDTSTASGLKWAAPAGSSGPAFRAFRNTSAQSISYGTYTKVQLNGETFDTDNCFDSTTNYRFTPTTAGYYQLGFTVQLASATEEILAIIYKNGTASSRGCTGKADTEYSFGLSSGTDLIYFNGSTDYVELYVIALQNAGSPSVYNGTAETFFTGVWIRS